jgi:uncharacterized membrane protein YqaE (UPF0057 family)
MNTKLFLIVLLISSTILSSCSVQRRYHRTGLDISWNHSPMKKDKNPEQNIEAPEVSAITQTAEVTYTEVQTLATDVAVQADNAVASAEFTATESLVIETVNDDASVTFTQNTAKKQALSRKVAQQSLNTKTMKQQVSAVKKDAKSNKAADDDDFILYVILAFIIPPLAVFLYEGSEWTQRCTVNLILTLLCGLPGLIHALVIILGRR